MGALTIFFFLKEKTLIAPSPIFSKHWALPHNSTSLDPQSQNKKKCVPLWPTFSLDIHRSWTLGKPYGIELWCYWEQLGEPHVNIMKTHWEQGEKIKNKKLLPDTPHPTKKKTGPLRSAYRTFSLAAWNFISTHSKKKEIGEGKLF
jgi:hypothetical protein